MNVQANSSWCLAAFCRQPSFQGMTTGGEPRGTPVLRSYCQYWLYSNSILYVTYNIDNTAHLKLEATFQYTRSLLKIGNNGLKHINDLVIAKLQNFSLCMGKSTLQLPLLMTYLNASFHSLNFRRYVIAINQMILNIVHLEWVMYSELKLARTPQWHTDCYIYILLYLYRTQSRWRARTKGGS